MQKSFARQKSAATHELHTDLAVRRVSQEQEISIALFYMPQVITEISMWYCEPKGKGSFVIKFYIKKLIS